MTERASALLIYPDGEHRWKPAYNEKLRGGLLNGVRPIAIYLLNPSELMEDSARLLVDPGNGQVYVTIGGGA